VVQNLKMKANIVSIGTEILIGQIQDTNSSWIADKLDKIGLSINRIVSIPDDKNEIFNVLNESLAVTDLIILTGGLGPTNDDITKKALNEFFKGTLIRHEATLEHIKRLFKQRNIELIKLNEDQALVPDNCTVLHNPHGTAPGLWFEKDGRVAISIPGVPYEMKYIVENEIIPRIKDRFKLPVIRHKTVLTQGIAESLLADKIKEWEGALSENIKIAYLPSPGRVRIRLSAQGENGEHLDRILSENIASLHKITDHYIFGYDDDTLESVIGRLLLDHGKTLSTAESCTGGSIAAHITSVSGSSNYFKGSIVAYDNMVKINTLNVRGDDIINFGAVSQQVVEQMAKGVLELFNTDYSIATSGIAGPTGGTPEKPVGTVWIAVASKNKVVSERYQFGEHRGRNITKSVMTSFNMLRRLILEV